MPPPASVEIQDVADALAALLESLGLWVPRNDAGHCAWAPSGLDSVPAGVIELPAIRRPDPLEIDDAPLGSNEWLLEFPVTLYFDLAEAGYAQTEAVSYVEALIQAVNTDHTLGLNGVDDSSVVSSEIVLIDDQARPMIAYECQVHVLKLVIDPDP